MGVIRGLFNIFKSIHPRKPLLVQLGWTFVARMTMKSNGSPFTGNVKWAENQSKTLVLTQFCYRDAMNMRVSILPFLYKNHINGKAGCIVGPQIKSGWKSLRGGCICHCRIGGRQQGVKWSVDMEGILNIKKIQNSTKKKTGEKLDISEQKQVDIEEKTISDKRPPNPPKPSKKCSSTEKKICFCSRLRLAVCWPFGIK